MKNKFSFSFKKLNYEIMNFNYENKKVFHNFIPKTSFNRIKVKIINSLKIASTTGAVDKKTIAGSTAYFSQNEYIVTFKIFEFFFLYFRISEYLKYSMRIFE